MKLRVLAVGFMILFVLFLAVGCSNDESKETKGNSKQTEDSGDKASSENSGGTLNIAVTAQPPTLDTHLTTATVALEITRNMFETLVTQNKDFDAVPMLAESIEHSDDGKTITFHLRENVKFHNGKEMVAEDVVASMNRWLEKSSRAIMLLSDATFEEVDKYTVVLKLEEYASDVLDIMAGQGQFPAIMPKEVIESAGAEGITEYIGTGPFKFEEWKQDQYIHFSKYEDYQPVEEEASGLAGHKEALVDDLYYQIVTDSSTRMSGLQTGEYDIVQSIPYDSYEQLNAMDNLKLHKYFSGSSVMNFNKKEGIMTDRKIRRALNSILDMDAIMLASFAHEDLYKMDPGYMNPDQANWSTKAGEAFYNMADVEEGKRLLEEAGYNGEPIQINVSRDYDYHYNAAIVAKEQLESAGVKVNLEVYDWPTLMDKNKDPSAWDIYFVTFGYVTTPSQLLALNPDNAGWTKDDKIDDLLLQIRTAENQTEADKIWEELQEYLWSDYAPIGMFGHFTNIIGTGDHVEGFVAFQGAIPWNTTVK